MIYEDDLSPNIPDSLYTQWFQLSEIVDGVRMGPEVRFSDLRGWYIESEATAELARRAFAIAQGEQECRKQAAPPEAQPTPGPWQIGYNEALVVAVGPEPCIVADCATDCAVSPERARANAALIARAPELAAENERLRGLLAQMVALVDHLLGLNGDNLMRAGLEPVDTLTPANHATIQAAKEAAHAE